MTRIQILPSEAALLKKKLISFVDDSLQGVAEHQSTPHPIFDGEPTSKYHDGYLDGRKEALSALRDLLISDGPFDEDIDALGVTQAAASAIANLISDGSHHLRYKPTTDMKGASFDIGFKVGAASIIAEMGESVTSVLLLADATRSRMKVTGQQQREAAALAAGTIQSGDKVPGIDGSTVTVVASEDAIEVTR